MASDSILHISGQLYLSMNVEGQSVGSGVNMVNTISVHENLATLVPAMQFKFNDRGMSLVRDLALGEGTRVSLMVGQTESDVAPREFRVFGTRQIPTIDGPQMFVTFVLDCPKFITEGFAGGVDGSSSAVMQRVAQDCGFEADVTATTDSMKWLSFGKTRAAFTQDVAMHGYLGANSSLAKCVTSTKRLRYKDLFAQLRLPPVATFGQNAQGILQKVIPVRESRDVSNSGVMNSWLNYGWNYTSHSLKGKSTVLDKFDVQTTDYLPINADVKREVGQSRIEYNRKWDCRNVHDKYNDAYYQNLRGLALFSQKLHILIEEPSNVDLFDPVEVSHTDADGEAGKNAGAYIVSAKVIYIASGVQYYEKLELIRPSVTVTGITKMLG